MSGPPPKPSRRPVRAPKEAQPAGSDDFDFGTAPQGREPAQQEPEQSSLEDSEPPAAERADSEPAASLLPPAQAAEDQKAASLPPRPTNRPQRPASRPIHILPAPADPPHVRQQPALRAELESLDAPGAANNEATVKRFEEVKAQLAEEGPGGTTAASLGYPALGPQKVPQSTPTPPPKPSTRPVRKPRARSSHDEPETGGNQPPEDVPTSKAENQGSEQKQWEEEKQKQEQELKQKEDHELKQKEEQERELKLKPEQEQEQEQESKRKQVLEQQREHEREDYEEEQRRYETSKRTETHTCSPESSEGPSSAPVERSPSHDRASKDASVSQDASSESSSNSSIPQSTADTSGEQAGAEQDNTHSKPAGSKLSATKEVSGPAQDPVLNEEHILKEASERNDSQDHSAWDSGKLEGTSHEASQKIEFSNTTDGQGDLPLEEQVITSSEAKNDGQDLTEKFAGSDLDKPERTDKKVSKFSEPEAKDAPKSNVVRSEELDVDPALSKEDNLGMNVSDLPQRTGHESSQKATFVQPATAAPDDAAPSSPKKHVAFTDAVTKIAANRNSRESSSDSDEASPVPEEDAEMRTGDEKRPDSMKMVEPSTHEPDPKSTPEENHLSELGAEPETEGSDRLKSEEEANGASADAAGDVSKAEDSTTQHKLDSAQDDAPNSSEASRGAEAPAGAEVDSASSKAGGPEDASERRVSDPVDPKDSSAKPARPQNRPDVKPKPVPKPKPKNALASRFEAALRESEAPKPKPVPRPKPREGSSRVSALQASMFANLNEALSRGPPPAGRPRFGSNDSQESHDESNAKPSSDRVADHKVDVNESAEAQLQAMPKNPRARAAGPRRAKRLPESAKPQFTIVTVDKPIWEIQALQGPSSSGESTIDSPLQSQASSTGATSVSKLASEAAAIDEEEAPGDTKTDLSLKAKEPPAPEAQKTSDGQNADNVASSGESTSSTKPSSVRKTEIDEEQERCAKEGLYAEPTVETRWVPDQISQAVPSQKPRKPEDVGDDGHVDSDDSAKSSQAGGPDLGADTENDLRTALQRHLSNESSEPSSENQSRGKSPHHNVTVEDLPPLGSLIDRAPSPPAVDIASSRASVDTLITPQRQKQEKSSASSLGVDSLSRYLDKSPQAGAAPSGWDRMPASSKLDLGEAEGLLKDVKAMKERNEAEHKEKTAGGASKEQSEASERKKQAYKEPSE